MTIFTLSPYVKAVVAGIAGAVAFASNLIIDGDFSEDDLAVAAVAIAQTYAVWRARNRPIAVKAKKGRK